MIISALNNDTVKLLTTTQVITSISSATKELIENALDADAKNVEINLTDNGCTLIEVKDDGCGISKLDAPYVALSSYTSKIRDFSDLAILKTYGFRGEALCALCAVSDVTIISKAEQDEAGVSYTINHSGHIIKSEFCHRSKVTRYTLYVTVQVRQLFKQVPVRRQIITNPKKANQDIKILEYLIKSYAMCKFFARITCRLNNNVIFAKPSVNTFEEAVTYILGKKVTCNMNWIDITDTEIKMKLMIPLKDTYDSNMLEVFHSGLQYIFVNNRPIKHKELEKALTKTILEALGQESLSRKKPIFVLYILINAANIDINLEPNKTSILFKDQNIIINTIEKYLENFYGIQREVQQETNCDISFASYQDYSQKANISNAENELPACKKQKLNTGGCVEKLIGKIVNVDENAANNLNFNGTNNFERVEQVQISTNGQIHQDKNAKKCEQNVEKFNTQSLNLCNSGSNDLQNVTLIYNNNNSSCISVDTSAKGDTEDSPPFELTPTVETLSQLPIVNLGNGFEWDNCSTIDTDEKENKIQNTNFEVSDKENKLNMKNRVLLNEWSKGHVFGLKGGTNIESSNYIEPNELVNVDTHGNVCHGFLKFSKNVRTQVMEQNPTMTAPQAAHIITNLWKKLSPEERGFYKDLARDEKSEYDIQKQKMKDKCTIDINKNKNRLLKALEKMKVMNLQEKENSETRTVVPWNVNLKKVTENFIDNPLYENTNSVVGLMCSNLWIVHESAHIWIVDIRMLRKELHKPDKNTNENIAENIEQLLHQWFSIKDDLSLLHPIYSLKQIRNIS
ncbi:PMS1 protein like protein 1 [Habropoda laboriosa]|uniref:PMS1 protein like protein 1 n=1 Tax=Habropoda laboriosa TaxID=597456 RepID=A0A0L7QVH6_9HYME|nr:PMS1 protein like protein 1 [Habropoda laboriosa]